MRPLQGAVLRRRLRSHGQARTERGLEQGPLSRAVSLQVVSQLMTPTQQEPLQQRGHGAVQVQPQAP